MKKKIILIATGIAFVLGLSGTAVIVTGGSRKAASLREQTEMNTDIDASEQTAELEQVEEEAAENILQEPVSGPEAAEVQKPQTGALQTPATTEEPAQQPAVPQTPSTAATTEAPQTPAWYEPGTTLPSETPVQQPSVSQTPVTPATTEAQQPAAPQTPSAAATTEAPHTPVWHEPVYEQVWVVDLEAGWYEYPIYEMVYCQQCYGCGGYMYGSEEVAAHTCHAGWHSASYSVQTGTGTEYIYEQGHYETVLVSEGYWE